MGERGLYRLQLVLLAAYFAVAVMLWPTLPQRLPIHFNFAGEPTTWTPTSVLSWFGLPLLAAAMTLFFYGLQRLAIRTPEIWSIPEKKRFLALPPVDRARIETYLHRLMPWSAILITTSFVGVHVSIYETATGRSSGQSWTSNLLIFAPVAVLILLAFWSTRSAAEQIRQASRDCQQEG